MERDYFTDERLWAINRRSWRLRVLWRRWRFPLLGAVIVLTWAYLVWTDLQAERARRYHAESDLALVVSKIAQYDCKGPYEPTKPMRRSL